jgi:hypothetical protein
MLSATATAPSRRIAERNKRNALALATATETVAEPPKRRNARFQRVLERLRNRSSITLPQFQAGDRLYRDYLGRARRGRPPRSLRHKLEDRHTHNVNVADGPVLYSIRSSACVRRVRCSHPVA